MKRRRTVTNAVMMCDRDRDRNRDRDKDRNSNSNRKQEKLTSFFDAGGNNNHHNNNSNNNNNNKRVREQRGDESRFLSCPLCERLFPVHIIERHAASCSPPSPSPPTSPLPLSLPIISENVISNNYVHVVKESMIMPIPEPVPKTVPETVPLPLPAVSAIIPTTPEMIISSQKMEEEDQGSSAARTSCASGQGEDEDAVAIAIAADGDGDSNSNSAGKMKPSKGNNDNGNANAKLQWNKIIQSGGGKNKQNSRHGMAMTIAANPYSYSYSYSEPLPGLYIFDDFISEEEEEEIMRCLDGKDRVNLYNSNPEPGTETGTGTETEPRKYLNVYQHQYQYQPWTRSKFNGKHRGKRWGAHCSLLDRKVYPEKDPLPECILNIVQKLRQLPLRCYFEDDNDGDGTGTSARTNTGTGIGTGTGTDKHSCVCVPNEANAIDYRKRAGDYLKPHVDDRQLSKEPIANLSLVGDCYMTFRLERDGRDNRSGSISRSINSSKTTKRRYDSSLQLPKEKKVLLKRRTLQVLTGRARYDYSHGIENRDLLTDRRVSLTMRESPLTTKTTTR